MILNSISKEYDNDFINLKGIPLTTFIDDMRRIYKLNINIEEFKSKNTLFFKINSYGILYKSINIRFHKYFALEMYFIFERLYNITNRNIYYNAMEALRQEPNINKYFTKLLSLPGEIANKLDNLKVPLFPFQRQFIESYYNARYKLGLHGYILAFEAGLGKTFTSIAAIYAFKLWPAIITAPRATLDGWKRSITDMISDCKSDEVKISYAYNPNKDKVPWKFFICNYERLDQALEYSKYATAIPKAIIIDECHNFRYLNTHRVQSLLNLKNSLNIKDIIAISGTPIKALASELIPIIKLIDPDFTDYPEKIFKSIYSKTRYDPITGITISKRLSLMLERKKQEDSIKLPPLEKYNIIVKLSNHTPYTLAKVKEDVSAYVEKHIPKYKNQVDSNKTLLFKILDDNKDLLASNNVNDKQIEEYKQAVINKINMFNDTTAQSTIKNFEINILKPISSQIFKEAQTVRRKCTSYIQILLGKGLGEFYVKGKIRLLAQMVKENINEIAKIIKEGEMKTIIFSTYIDPLISVKDSLESIGIGCVLHTGQSDIRETRAQFKEDDSKQVFLGTVGAVGTGKL